MSAMDFITQLAGLGGAQFKAGALLPGQGIAGQSAAGQGGNGAAALFQSALQGFLASAAGTANAANNISGNAQGNINALGAANGNGAANKQGAQNLLDNLGELAGMSPEELAAALSAEGISPDAVLAAANNLQAATGELDASGLGLATGINIGETGIESLQALTSNLTQAASLMSEQALSGQTTAGASSAATASLLSAQEAVSGRVNNQSVNHQSAGSNTASQPNTNVADQQAAINAIGAATSGLSALVNGNLMGDATAAQAQAAADEAALANPQNISQVAQAAGAPVLSALNKGIRPQSAEVTPLAGEGSDDGLGNALLSGQPSKTNLVAALAAKKAGVAGQAMQGNAGNAGSPAAQLNVSASAMAALAAQNSNEAPMITLGKGEFTSQDALPQSLSQLGQALQSGSAVLNTTNAASLISGGLGALEGNHQPTLAKLTPQMTTPAHYTSAGIANNVGMQISRSFVAGQTEFTMRIDPPELGRVNVRMSFAQDGSVKAMITADTREALQLLQRESGVLERALEQAGAKLDQGSLSFSLKDGNNNGQHAHNDSRPGGHAHGDEFDEALTGEEDVTMDVQAWVDNSRELDIRI